jgi:rod shape-determining protein MreC
MKFRDARKTYLYVSLTAFVIILLATIGFLKPIFSVLENSISKVSAPMYSLYINIKELPLWNEKKILTEEVSRLANETRELQSLKARLSVLERENQAIRDALLWAQDKDREYIISKIIGRPLHAPRTFLILNQGRVHGVSVGLPVVINNDILVGTIVETRDFTSYVRLMTDNESLVSAKLLGGQEPVGAVKGELGLSLRLTLIPQHLNPDMNEIVVTSGLDEFIPPELIIGAIDDNITDTDDFFKEVSLKTVYDTNQLNIVSIIKGTL